METRYALDIIRNTASGPCHTDDGDFSSESLAAGQVFYAKSREQFNMLIQAGAGIPASLPCKVECVVLVTGSFGDQDTRIVLERGQTVLLPREHYTRLCMAGKVKPANPDTTWSPESAQDDSGTVKRFYDDTVERPKESWITKWGIGKGVAK